MPDSTARTSKRFLDPMDRLSEVLFGLIMVLTFTGSLSVAEAGQAEIRDMLLGALGCNLAWGIIDAFMYLMSCLSERSRGLLALRTIRQASDAAEAYRAIADALPPVVASALRPQELDLLRQRLKELPDPPVIARLSKEDWLGAAAVFLLVFVSVLPVVIPFVLMADAQPALRVSNVLAVTMLFLIGWQFGRQIGRPPWRIGLWMLLSGCVLVAMTMALGG
jgi:hypothetical protein